MQAVEIMVQWLTENESALSAMAAILVITGITYGGLRYVLTPILKRRNQDGTENTLAMLKKKAKPSAATALHNDNFSLAVLLFEALSNDSDDEFLAAGITSEVIAYVTMVPNIRVSSRLSSYQVSRDRADMFDVADQLNTRFVLTGSIRRGGNRARVIAQLADIKTNTEIWAQTYDREVSDLFDVQQDIARCIVSAVLGEVKLAETLFAGSAPTKELDALGLMQKAYHFWLTSFTPQGLLDACDYLRQAIKIDPDYSGAQAALAMLLTNQMLSGICKDPDACAAEALALINKSYNHSPNDIDVLENIGVALQNLGESTRAEQALRRVMELAPLNLIARGYLALLLGFTGGEKGAEEAKHLILENFATAPKHPSAPYWNFFLAIAEQSLGNHDTAADLARLSLSGQPGWVHSHFVIANTQCINGDVDAATASIASATDLNPLLTAQVYAENAYRIVGGEQQASPFVGGLKQYKLVT